jgi:hypothetical protein
MLPFDLWQFCVIDYLKYDDQCKLVKLISGVQLTNLIGIQGLTDTKLKEYKYVKWLYANYNENITDDGIKHMTLHTLHASQNSKITDEGIKHMSLHTLHARGNSHITDEGIKNMSLHTLNAMYNSRITDDGVKHMNIVNYTQNNI